MIDEIRNRKRRMAICYDFDKTLSPDDMQSFTLIPSLQMDKAEFWKESDELAKENRMDKNLAWMYELITLSKAKRKSIKREYFTEVGKMIPLFPGVEEWFDLVNEYAASKDIEAEHYIISSGLKEIIEGSRIADRFQRIYASSYLYSPDGIAEWPAQAINYTNKTQYIFRIAKGIFEEYDERVNDSMSDSDLYIPYENIVYIGDSATDIPCMRLVKSRGGYSIGVFDPEKKHKSNVFKLYSDGRLSFYAAADYTASSDLMKYMRTIIDEIAAGENRKMEQKILEVRAREIQGMADKKKELSMSYEELVKRAQTEIKTRLDNGTYCNEQVKYGHYDLWEKGDQINLWAYWQGHQIKDLEAGVDILLVGQDWGNVTQDPKITKTIELTMEGALETSYDPSYNPTNSNLVKLFKILGCDITKPNPGKRLFFTNYSLGYRQEGSSEQGGMTKKLMLQDRELFRALVKAIKPKYIICLGQLTYECVIEHTVKGGWVEQLQTGKPFVSTYPGNDEIKVFGVAHCGARGVNNIGGAEVNRKAWKVIAKEIGGGM